MDLSTDVYMTPGCLVHSARKGPLHSLHASLPDPVRPPWSSDPEHPPGRLAGVAAGGQLHRGHNFTEAMLSSDSVGNIQRGGVWAEKEGFFNVTGRYCDTFDDWWPDDTLPVGYYATTLCLG